MLEAAPGYPSLHLPCPYAVALHRHPCISSCSYPWVLNTSSPHLGVTATMPPRTMKSAQAQHYGRPGCMQGCATYNSGFCVAGRERCAQEKCAEQPSPQQGGVGGFLWQPASTCIPGSYPGASRQQRQPTGKPMKALQMPTAGRCASIDAGCPAIAMQPTLRGGCCAWQTQPACICPSSISSGLELGQCKRLGHCPGTQQTCMPAASSSPAGPASAFKHA